MAKPITPNEAKLKSATIIPDEVIEAFNECIIKNLQNNYSTVLQKDVVNLIKEKMNITEPDDFNIKWLDIENIYENAGWKVEYDKPGYCESYDASFKFSKKRS